MDQNFGERGMDTKGTGANEGRGKFDGAKWGGGVSKRRNQPKVGSEVLNKGGKSILVALGEAWNEGDSENLKSEFLISVGKKKQGRLIKRKG